MAGFFLKVDPYASSGSGFPTEVTVSSLTAAVGDCLTLQVGATGWTAATSSSNHFQPKAIVRKAVVSADTVAEVTEVHLGQVWAVEAANTADTAHNGDRMVLTDSNTVNNTGTDSAAQGAIVRQVGIDSTVGTTTILVKFVGLQGVDPDAT